ncbi:ribosomal protein S18-alanine N-acetyltransferase [candidate division KSB1 bacterium]|nr:ribosomal protein S18-alanine N-acetyltransferase [candidate division KSB1 bacterium]RQW11464.1 MAG: ribosomal-protein-alanine N-acetyltransferase [candidate division KSB1 bacterium]
MDSLQKSARSHASIPASKLFQKNSVTLRLATDADMEEIATLEQQLFAPPWSANSFRAELSNRASTTLVLACASRIIGYAVMWQISAEMQITKMAVAPPFRNMGIATWTMERIFEWARQQQVRDVFIEVRASNSSALCLYEKFGFALQGRRKGYYEAPREDALLLAAHI